MADTGTPLQVRLAAATESVARLEHLPIPAQLAQAKVVAQSLLALSAELVNQVEQLRAALIDLEDDL